MEANEIQALRDFGGMVERDGHRRMLSQAFGVLPMTCGFSGRSCYAGCPCWEKQRDEEIERLKHANSYLTGLNEEQQRKIEKARQDLGRIACSCSQTAYATVEHNPLCSFILAQNILYDLTPKEERKP